MSKRVSAILLAAGRGSRYGGKKQLATLEGTTLVERAISTLWATSVGEIVLVLGSEATAVRDGLRREEGERLRVVMNPRYREGLSTSLKAGLASLRRDTDAVVVVLADQPFVTPWLIDALIERYRESGRPVVTSASGDLLAPPVLLDKSTFPEVLALEGDVGAKSIVMRHSDAERVEVEPEVLTDIDRPEDMERARRVAARRAKRRGRAGDGPGPARPSAG